MLLVVPHLACNLHCLYCFERQFRKTHNCKMDYNIDTILRRMEELKDNYPHMCLHGGEPLMMKKEDVRKILSKMKELTGASSIQTNGSLIDDDFVEIFKECSTSVGLSYDGPGELSEYRTYKLKNKKRIDESIKNMIDGGVKLSLIIVVSRSNAGTPERLRKLKKYLLELKKAGIAGRVNPCGQADGCELNEKQLKSVYLDLANFCLNNGLNWSPFEDVINGLQGKRRVCVLENCDPYHTESAAELLGDGSVTNCMRNNSKDMLLRNMSEMPYKTRDEVLLQTPQEFGGCQGCKYFNACHGGCPTMAIDSDWRNRTYDCALWKTLFEFYENVLTHCGIPLNLSGVEGQCNTGVSTIMKDGQHIDHRDHLDSENPSKLPSNLPNTQLKDEGGGYSHIDHTDSLHNDAPTRPNNFPNGQLKDEGGGYSHIDHTDSLHNDAPIKNQ